jgi:two-component system chemotaxis response regulator CheB
VRDARHGDRLRPGTVYLASPDRHLVVNPDLTLGMEDGRRIRGTLSSAKPLFESASNVCGPGVVAVVLSGSGFDATDGVQSVKAEGGVVIAQHPESAQFPSMPLSAIKTGEVDLILPLEQIAPTLLRLVGHAGGTSTTPVAPAT